MLFHITHQHSEATCPAHDADLMQATLGELAERLKAPGIQLRGFYSNAAAHRVYIIVETDSLDPINAALFPTFKMGTAEIEPVTEAAATVAKFQEIARE